MSINNITDNVVDLLKVLADPTRLDILEFLKIKGEKSAGAIQKALDKTQSTMSQHLKILVIAELLSVRKESRSKYYKIKYLQIFKILSLIKLFLSNRAKERIEELTNIDIIDTLY